MTNKINLDDEQLFNILALDLSSAAKEFISTGSSYNKGQVIAIAKTIASQYANADELTEFLEADHAK